MVTLITIAVLSLGAAASQETPALSNSDLAAERLRQEISLLRGRVLALESRQGTPLMSAESAGDVEMAAFGCPCEPRGSNYPTLRWSGFIQIDAGWVSQSQPNIAALGDIESKTGLRRVRLRAGGELRRNVSYIIDLDFTGSGHPSFRDAKFTLHEQGWLQNVQLGYFQQPMGFDAMTSGRELLLLERQLAFAFVPFRQTGIGSYGVAFNEKATWSVSGFRFPTDPFGVSQGDAGGWGYANRFTLLPYYNERDDKLVHVGASYSFVNPGTDSVRYAIEPGFFVIDPTDQTNAAEIPSFVDTGDLPTDNVNLTGVELATQWGSLNAQAEAIGAFVNQTDRPAASFYGVSAKIAYVFTGETHPYDRHRGVFTRIIPNRAGTLTDLLGGAWEAVAAWSLIDLNDAGIEGGRGQTLIVGLNRYLDRHTKFQFNLIRALLDDTTAGPSAATFAVIRAQTEF